MSGLPEEIPQSPPISTNKIENLQTTRSIIFHYLDQRTRRELTYVEFTSLFAHIHHFHSDATDDEQIREENMTENEKRIATGYLSLFDRILLTFDPDVFVRNKLKKETPEVQNDVYSGFVTLRCEIFPEFFRVSNISPTSYKKLIRNHLTIEVACKYPSIDFDDQMKYMFRVLNEYQLDDE